MLTLGRKFGQWTLVGNVRIKIERGRRGGDRIVLTIDAPPEVAIVREELLDGVR